MQAFYYYFQFPGKKMLVFYCQQCCDEWSTVCTKAKPISFLLVSAVNPCEQTVDCGDVLSLWEIPNQVYTLEMTGFSSQSFATPQGKCVNVTTGIWTKPKTLLKFSRNSVCTVLAKKLNDALNCDFGYFCSKKSNDFHLLGV